MSFLMYIYIHAFDIICNICSVYMHIRIQVYSQCMINVTNECGKPCVDGYTYVCMYKPFMMISLVLLGSSSA